MRQEITVCLMGVGNIILHTLEVPREATDHETLQSFKMRVLLSVNRHFGSSVLKIENLKTLYLGDSTISSTEAGETITAHLINEVSYVGIELAFADSFSAAINPFFEALMEENPDIRDWRPDLVGYWIKRLGTSFPYEPNACQTEAAFWEKLIPILNDERKVLLKQVVNEIKAGNSALFYYVAKQIETSRLPGQSLLHICLHAGKTPLSYMFGKKIVPNKEKISKFIVDSVLERVNIIERAKMMEVAERLEIEKKPEPDVKKRKIKEILKRISKKRKISQSATASAVASTAAAASTVVASTAASSKGSVYIYSEPGEEHVVRSLPVSFAENDETSEKLNRILLGKVDPRVLLKSKLPEEKSAEHYCDIEGFFIGLFGCERIMRLLIGEFFNIRVSYTPSLLQSLIIRHINFLAENSILDPKVFTANKVPYFVENIHDSSRIMIPFFNVNLPSSPELPLKDRESLANICKFYSLQYADIADSAYYELYGMYHCISFDIGIFLWRFLPAVIGMEKNSRICKSITAAAGYEKTNEECVAAESVMFEVQRTLNDVLCAELYSLISEYISIPVDPANYRQRFFPPPRPEFAATTDVSALVRAGVSVEDLPKPFSQTVRP